MQCTGFICQQHKMHVRKTGSDTIIKYQSEPKDCVVKVVSENWEDRIVRETAYSPRTTKNNTQTMMGSHEIQSIDLRVGGITNGETYKKEQCMLGIADQLWRLVTFKDDSPKDNILSEQAVKKIHEARNCESNEFQKRTNKIMSTLLLIEAGFQVCPCEGQLGMWEKMLSSIRQQFKQLVAEAQMTFRGKRRARQASFLWRRVHSQNW